MWLALFYSGIHATVAGILVALCIPARARYKPGLFSERVSELMGKFSATNRPGETMLINVQQYTVLRGLDEELHLAEPPLQRMEGTLHLPVALIVIPLFALANAAIPLDLEHFSTTLLQPVSLGIIFGLVAGKFIGITLFSWLVVKARIAVLPEGVDNDTTFASPWFRHPVDFDMYNVRTKKDYQGYGGVGVNNYEVTAPVASSDVSSLISTGVYSASGKAIVTCISCHRAHGTPNDAILRWNYKAWPGGGYAGCQVCHTIKD
jgi:hypothetical protein